MLRCTSTAATKRRVSCTAHLLQRLLQALQQHNCIVCMTQRVMLQLLAEQLSLLSSERCWCCCCCCCCHDALSDSQVELGYSTAGTVLDYCLRYRRVVNNPQLSARRGDVTARLCSNCSNRAQTSPEGQQPVTCGLSGRVEPFIRNIADKKT